MTPLQRAVLSDLKASYIRRSAPVRFDLAVLVFVFALLGLPGLLTVPDGPIAGQLFGVSTTLGAGLVGASYVALTTRVKWWLTAAGAASAVVGIVLLYVFR
jgi:hypothetical protein